MSYAVQLAYRSINTIPPPGLINGVAGATYANPIVITSTYSVITGDMIRHQWGARQPCGEWNVASDVHRHAF